MVVRQNRTSRFDTNMRGMQMQSVADAAKRAVEVGRELYQQGVQDDDIVAIFTGTATPLLKSYGLSLHPWTCTRSTFCEWINGPLTDLMSAQCLGADTTRKAIANF